MSDGSGLRVRTKVAFGVGSVAESAVWAGFTYFSMLFYQNVLGVPPDQVGIAVSLALVLDAMADPVVGWLSDRWRSRLGRRHPFLYAAPIPLAVCVVAMYSPPQGMSHDALFYWLALWATLLRTCLSIYQVPHLALGAELSSDYRERSVVMAYNSVLGVVGGSATYFCSWTYFGTFADNTMHRPAYLHIALGVGVLSALMIVASAWFTRDQIPRLPQPPAQQAKASLGSLLRETFSCLHNRNYLVLMLGFFFLSATIGMRETLESHINLFFWQLPSARIRYFALASPVGFAAAFFVAPWLNARIGKRNSIILSVIGFMIGLASPVCLRLSGLFVANDSPWLFPLLYLSVVIYWFATAGLMISVMSALADVADEHELSSGLRQEGVFYAARTFFGKLVNALGHLVAGFALKFIHFAPGSSPGSVAPQVLHDLGWVYGPIGVLPGFIAIAFYARYAIGKSRLAEIQAQLRARQQSHNPLAAQPATAASVAEALHRPAPAE